MSARVKCAPVEYSIERMGDRQGANIDTLFVEKQGVIVYNQVLMLRALVRARGKTYIMTEK